MDCRLGSLESFPVDWQVAINALDAQRARGILFSSDIFLRSFVYFAGCFILRV